MARTTIIIILLAATLSYIFGCAPPQPVVEEKETLTPEQLKARQDSLREAQLKELKIIRSFAYAHYNNKSWADAAKYYEELARKDTSHQFNDYGKWAQCYIQMNVSPDSVKMVYQQGIAAFPDDAYLHASLGHIFKTQGALDSAVVHYEAAVANEPENLDYTKTLAELYTRADRPTKAIGLYRKILAQEPDNKEIAETLDHLVKRYMSPEEYIKSLEESVAHFPDDLDKKFELAKAYTDIGQNEKALSLLEKILQEQPDNTRALSTMGDVQQNLRHYAAAISAYQKILSLEPENTAIMVEISDCYRLLEQFGQARIYARKALAKDPKLGSAYIALAALYEAAADQKTGGELPNYYDKLVYLVAYGLYQEAKNSGDYRVLDQAKTHLKYLKESKLIPEYADWFMHQDVKDPSKEEAYNWINSAWPELRYIEKYLEKIAKK